MIVKIYVQKQNSAYIVINLALTHKVSIFTLQNSNFKVSNQWLKNNLLNILQTILQKICYHLWKFIMKLMLNKTCCMKLSVIIVIQELLNTLFVVIIIKPCFVMNAKFKNVRYAKIFYKLNKKLSIYFQMIQLCDIYKSFIHQKCYYINKSKY